MLPYLIAGAIGFVVAKLFEEDEAPKYADGGSVLLAPNGKPSNLNAEQYKLVRSEDFKKWFGDWQNDPETASKVVDTNGEPLVCYHSSNKKFTKFNYEVSYDGAIWFTDNLQKLFNNEAGASGQGVIYKVFLDIKKMGDWDNYDKGISDLLNEKFNGAKLDDDYICFEPNQIKLADGTNTTFDGNNPDIRFDGGGNVDNKILMKNDFLNEQKELQRNSKYAILLDATWNNYTDEMRDVLDNLKNELIKKLGYNPLINYHAFSDKDSKILMFDDDSNLLGLLIFTIDNQYTTVPRFSPPDIKPEKVFENNNNVFYIEYIFSFGKCN